MLVKQLVSREILWMYTLLPCLKVDGIEKLKV